MKKPYSIDGEPVTMDELIERGRALGYDGDDYGTYYTSGAAKVLRDHGHIVTQNTLDENTKS